jgi:hypothetical protein
VLAAIVGLDSLILAGLLLAVVIFFLGARRPEASPTAKALFYLLIVSSLRQAVAVYNSWLLWRGINVMAWEGLLAAVITRAGLLLTFVVVIVVVLRIELEDLIKRLLKQWLSNGSG